MIEEDRGDGKLCMLAGRLMANRSSEPGLLLLSEDRVVRSPVRQQQILDGTVDGTGARDHAFERTEEQKLRPNSRTLGETHATPRSNRLQKRECT